MSSTGGVVRLRKISDLRNTLEGVGAAFDQAINDAHNKESPQSKFLVFHNIQLQKIDMAPLLNKSYAYRIF